jgi:hypothetical protein
MKKKQAITKKAPPKQRVAPKRRRGTTVTTHHHDETKDRIIAEEAEADRVFQAKNKAAAKKAAVEPPDPSYHNDLKLKLQHDLSQPEIIEALIRRHAPHISVNGESCLSSNGDAILVAAFKALGWSDPYHERPALEAATVEAPERAVLPKAEGRIW